MSIEFLLTSLIVVATPGTGALFTMAAGLARGARASAVAALACTIGTLPHAAAALTGLAALLHTSALAFQVLKYLGVAYLLYMAWTMLRDKGALTVPEDPASILGSLPASMGGQGVALGGDVSYWTQVLPFVVLMACSLRDYKGVPEFFALARSLPEMSFELVLNAAPAAVAECVSDTWILTPPTSRASRSASPCRRMAGRPSGSRVTSMSRQPIARAPGSDCMALYTASLAAMRAAALPVGSGRVPR